MSEFDDTSDMTEEECRQMLRIVGDERDALREERDEARAELAEARRDVEHLYELVERQSDLLRGVVDALRGPPPPRTSWSVHDAPELAVAAKAELAEARRERDALRAEVEHLRADYGNACKAVVQAHAAATGRPGEGPFLGVIEDVAAVRAERDALREMVDSTKVAAWDKCAEIIRRAQAAEAERDRLREAVEVLQTDVYNLTQKVIPNIRKERDDTEAELAEARENEKQLGSAYEHNALAAMRFRDELAQAKQERETLREALEKIASDRYNFRDFCDIARAALEGKA